MGPLSIGEIRRETIEQTIRFGRYRWRIIFDSPKSEIAFIAAGFVQELRATPVESPQQSLGWEERQRRCAAESRCSARPREIGVTSTNRSCGARAAERQS